MKLMKNHEGVGRTIPFALLHELHVFLLLSLT